MKKQSWFKVILIFFGLSLSLAYGEEKVSSIEELQNKMTRMLSNAKERIKHKISKKGILPRCQKSDEFQLGACYRKCDNSSTGIGPFCWKKCRKGFKDLGIACHRKGHTQKKKNYTRGLGQKPVCSNSQEKFGPLCYKKCKSGYNGVGKTCFQSCPSGHKAFSHFCKKSLFSWTKREKYPRGRGNLPASCPQGKEKDTALCYKSCKEGYVAKGPLCIEKCPPNTKNLGLACRTPGKTYFKKKEARRTELPLYKGVTRPKNIKYITDTKGRALVLHGVNSSGSSKSDPEFMSWVKEKDVIQETKEFGMNAVRLLIFWAAVEPQKGVYDEEYLERLAKRVKWYTDNGAWVVLDMHQDIYGYAVNGNGAPGWATDVGRWEKLKNKRITALLPEKLKHLWWLQYLNPAVGKAYKNFWGYGDKKYLQDHYIGAWQKVAEKFKDNPGVLGYDLMNEPHHPNLSRYFEKKLLGKMYKRLIKGIREIDNEKWIFFEPRSFGVNFGFPSYLKKVKDPREGQQKLVYAPHMYPILLHENVSYNSLDRKNIQTWSYFRSKEIDMHQTPLWVGEVGGNEHVKGFDKYLEEAFNMFDYMGASWMWWSNNPSSWGLLNHKRQENKKLHYLVRTYPRAVAGHPQGFSFNVHNGHFQLKFKTKKNIKGPTEIFIPKRHYPNGFDIKIYNETKGLTGQVWDEKSQILYLETEHSSTPYNITIKRK